MTQEVFWEIIEKSWLDSAELHELRADAIQDNNDEILEKLSGELDSSIIENYTKRLSELDKNELTSFIHILEERIYNIDREEIHTYTDGSDDGFLYCRCFIVGMGKAYYDMIDKTPSKATFDLEAETFGFTAYQVYETVFKEEFDRYSKHSMASVSNRNGWG